MATPFGFGLSWWSRHALVWGCALALILILKGRRPWHRAIGWGLMSVPLWDTLFGILNSLSTLLDSGSRLVPVSRAALSRSISQRLVEDIGWLGVGFMTWSGTWRASWREGTRPIARAMARVGWPTYREGRSAAIGWLGFPILVAVALALDQATVNWETLRNGQESAIWRNMTPYHALLLAVAAGFGEELFYRGFLQTAAYAGLKRKMNARRAMFVAIAIQSLIFGFAHSGYGTWAHVLGPILFGVAMGFIAWRLGIWAATVLHVLIDVYAFGVYTFAAWPWMQALLVGLLGVNVLATIIYGGPMAYRAIIRFARPASL